MNPAEPGLALVGPDRLLRFEGQVFRCALGKGGIRPAEAKREGDGGTPAALLPLRRVLYRADRGPAPRCAVPVEPLAPADGWCDDPAHRLYNRAVPTSFDASHERLWREDHVYDVIGVLGWNDSPPERGRGSAIFLHLAREDFAPTEGCVALGARDLGRVLEAGLRAILVEA